MLTEQEAEALFRAARRARGAGVNAPLRKGFKQADLSCPICGVKAVLFENSARFYHGRDYGPLWACVTCDTRVGCHPGTTVPLGPPADAETRKARSEAHAVFDVLWREKQRRERRQKIKDAGHVPYRWGKKAARNAAYAWLAEQMGMLKEDCHIGHMTAEQCRRVVEICSPHAERLRRRNAA